ncbi:MAG: hypothetical protein GYB67_11385 [Chloroflexi bacterium]|nr:hypothetical protein [Chloroflexota bacterium]
MSENSNERREALGEWAREARQRADEVKSTIVQQLNEGAETIRREVRQTDSISADDLERADEVAEGLERAANYLNTTSYEQMGSDVTHAIEEEVSRNPIRNLVIAFAVGVVVGLILRSNGRSSWS